MTDRGRFFSIRHRIILYSTLLIVAVVATIAGFIIMREKRLLKEQVFQLMNLETMHLEQTAQINLGIDELPIVSKIEELKKIGYVTYAYVIDKNNRIAYCFDRRRECVISQELQDGVARSLENRQSADTVRAQYPDPLDTGGMMYDFSRIINNPMMGKVGYAIIGFSDMIIREQTKSLLLFLVPVFMAFLLLSTGASIALSNTILNPIRKLSEGVRTISEGDYDFRIQVSSRDEIGHFAEEFNRMTGRFKGALSESERKSKIFRIYTRQSLAQMVDDGIDPTRRHPQKINMAVLFCDIRNFTALFDNADPEAVVRFLNEYFGKLNIEIHNNQGEIDKLIGDCIMAGFVDPDNAVSAAIKIQIRLNEYNKRRIANGEPPVRSGVGINYGQVIAGNIGSESKMDFTVIGDPVNIASRLESLTKYYTADIIISEDVLSHLKARHDTLLLDNVVVKGKNSPLKIYEVYDHKDEKTRTALNDAQGILDKALGEYIKGNFPAAISIYESIQLHPQIKGLVDYYKGRCLALMQAEKEGSFNISKWNGYYEFKEK